MVFFAAYALSLLVSPVTRLLLYCFMVRFSSPARATGFSAGSSCTFRWPHETITQQNRSAGKRAGPKQNRPILREWAGRCFLFNGAEHILIHLNLVFVTQVFQPFIFQVGLVVSCNRSTTLAYCFWRAGIDLVHQQYLDLFLFFIYVIRSCHSLFPV